MAKMFSECLKTGVAVHIPLISLVCLFKFSGRGGRGGNPQGSKKNVQDFCRTLVIVKSSELTRTGREGGREGEETGMEGEKVFHGLFWQ